MAAEELPPSPEGEDARSTAATSRRHVPIHAGSAWRDPGRVPASASCLVHCPRCHHHGQEHPFRADDSASAGVGCPVCRHTRPPRPASAPSPVRLAHASNVAARVAPDGHPHPCSRAFGLRPIDQPSILSVGCANTLSGSPRRAHRLVAARRSFSLGALPGGSDAFGFARHPRPRPLSPTALAAPRTTRFRTCGHGMTPHHISTLHGASARR